MISVRAGCALGKDGRVRCWGHNRERQVAPTEDPSFVATTPIVVEDVEDAVELSVAQRFGCARVSDGTLRVWGDDGVSPLAFDGKAVALSSAGVGSHACAIAESGAVQCVGQNSHGQLGIAPERWAVKTMMEVPGLADVVAVATSQTHSCALAGDGNVWCWGGNGRGGLGDGTLDDRREPRSVAHLLDVEPPPPAPPKVVDEGPVESTTACRRAAPTRRSRSRSPTATARPSR